MKVLKVFLLMQLFCIELCFAEDISTLQDLNIVLGVWEGSDRAAESVFGKLKVNKKTISWGGRGTSSEYCETGYKIEKDPYGLTFRNQLGDIYKIDSSSTFLTYKLNLKPKKCVGEMTAIRMTLEAVDSQYMHAMIYYNLENINSYIHFHR